MKLLPVLIPKPLWGINAHSLIGGSAWQRMRRDTFLRDKHCCVICQQQGPLECHEVFLYDDATGTAVLTKLESRCAECHSFNHLGRLRKVDPQGFKRALVCIGRINDIGSEEVILLVKNAFSLHKNRTRPWQLKVTEDLLKPYPELKRLVGYYPIGEKT
jgi:hypothetical protein